MKTIASALACAFLCACGGPSQPPLREERALALTASTLALTNPDAFFRTALTTYQPSVQKALKPRAQMMLFENWALQDRSPFATRAQALSSLHSAYVQLSTALSTANVIAPCASVWETVFAQRPQESPTRESPTQESRTQESPTRARPMRGAPTPVT